MTRIAPLTRPYPEALAPALNALTPEGGDAPMLFRIIGTSQRAWEKFTGGSLLDKGPLPMRERELAIFRTAARIGADYEWGMHATLFAERCAIDRDQLEALANKDAESGGWSESDAALIATVDILIDRRHLDDAEFARISEHFSSDQIFEIVQLVAFYQGVALIIGTFDIPQEPGTSPIPA
ncbi:carboxymuconolactone decarboxylase family protein [Parasphingopyxis lamellibrachiae]|uniref:Alkylhydroperoxidase family enzyme n=1 Tax=Parasphingopyxis lamellibrachiae TaxID=680125 RepID=A0A3D9FE69_9SPHN|nr:carboxymuconolactone decarboxylase family protein [Parasphingopyxis lamellibrachiae]RED16135.1 alkylhydroperoxidase family enzyme [Parasphingopyxis lamellibrachiae]